MKKIGVTLSIPELEPFINKYRKKYDKYFHLEPHLTIYLSKYHGVENLGKMIKLVEKLKKHTTKIVLNDIKMVKKFGRSFVFLSVENSDKYIKLKKLSQDAFGKEIYKSDFHITLGYNIDNSSYKKIKKEISKKLPIKIKGTKFKIVEMDIKNNKMNAKEHYISRK